jgi:ATP-dependent Clp protease ATP-binding subunit ClpB
VKGQSQAIQKTSDILRRSVMGLTGAQGSAVSAAGRPKGILFFAGPTGVGKTELAKAISEVVFRSESAYTRFDMSEFSQEHSDARLIGSPPGFIGHDAGGELTNAIREKPFSVVLFDEIEKAHPRILDKFLQILEEGRLTDSRGETVYFSEAVIVFTSNLGTYTEKFATDEHGNRFLKREQTIDARMLYPEVEDKVRQEIQKHFKEKLGRPELLNRIGDNVVVFDFIRSDIAHLIFHKMMTNIIDHVKKATGIKINVSHEARAGFLGVLIWVGKHQFAPSFESPDRKALPHNSSRPSSR